MTVTTTDQQTPGATAAPARVAAVEWQTLLLILATYAGWLAITVAYGRWPLAIVAPIAAVLITLHSSLQHEIVHGHPTRWHAVNRLNPISHLALRAQQTLAGRVIIGSFWRIGMFLRGELRAVARNEAGVRAIWVEHLLWCVPVVLWLQLVCGMPLWIYLIAMAIPSNGLLLVRAFAEHRAGRTVRERIAIVEGSWILGPLFLFNNLHSLHHEAPMIPWYQYNARYRLTRERLIAENGGLVYATYFEVARRFLFRPHDALQHPMNRVPHDQAG